MGLTQADRRVCVGVQGPSWCRTELEAGEKRWRQAWAFVCPLPRALKIFHMARGQVYREGPGFGARGIELHGPRQVTALEPQLRVYSSVKRSAHFVRLM